MAAGDFASLTDLATVLGRTSSTELTAAESLRGTLLLTLASGLITDAVGRDSAWAIALNPVPIMLRAVCLEVAARVMRNPSGARSESEQIGQYQHSVSWTDGAHGLTLTDAEEMLCRRTILGLSSGSSVVESIADKLAVNTPSLDALLEAGHDDPPIYDWT